MIPLSSRFRPPLATAALLAASFAAPAWASPPPYTLFESGQVRPLALSSNGETLFAVNTPDDRLEIFHARRGRLSPAGSVAVGVEPVAVAVRSNNEVWVVNHVSDSVSIVRIDDNGARVVRTLLVGDEPRDILFAGPRHDRAFITTAHRGQNSPVDPQLTTAGVGRADVWVFDANNLGSSLGGTPLSVLTLFTDTPRALAASPDGKTVYAAGFLSGNRTTTINERLVPDGGQNNGGLPLPNTASDGTPQPETGLVVQFNGQHWVDKLGRVWDDKVKFSLPDKDVFVIDATSSTPALVPGLAGVYPGVGTVLFNMIVNPASGKVYVSNTDANNLTRFEGPGVFAMQQSGFPSVRGHLAESHISVLDHGTVTSRHLNKHIDYSQCCADAPNAESTKSLAFPQGMAISRDGRTLYVTAFGSSKVGIFDTAQLESDSFVPSTANQVSVSGGGPSGAVLDEASGVLYVATRFDNAVSVIDTRRRAEIGHVAMFSPEPSSITVGRRLLYDASTTSSHGDSACASCHINGDFDGLAWDLGNPEGTLVPTPGPAGVTFATPIQPLPLFFFQNKGPMTTQSLRGMTNHGSMHWRGDRTGGNDAASTQPDSGIFDEQAAFKKFNVAFPGLLGRGAQLTDAEMQAFTDFILQVTYPPNPIRALDNSLTPDQQGGKDFFVGKTMNGLPSDTFQVCSGCHTLDANGNAQYGVSRPGFFGSDGRYTFEAETQYFKIPHLRNMYQKVGMFGMADTFDPTTPFGTINPGNNGDQGDQVRGFGFLHDGSVDTIFRFHNGTPFDQSKQNPGGFAFGAAGDPLRRQMEQFMLAFDSNMAPIVGQQVTLSSGNGAVAGPRIDLLEARARAGECDVVAKSSGDNGEVGYLYIAVGAGAWAQSYSHRAPLGDAELRARVAGDNGTPITFTCAPPGSGQRIALDRDGDGFDDGDEQNAGSNSGDARSTPNHP